MTRFLTAVICFLLCVASVDAQVRRFVLVTSITGGQRGNKDLMALAEAKTYEECVKEAAAHDQTLKKDMQAHKIEGTPNTKCVEKK